MSAEQFRRFDQLVMQARGAKALVAPDVRQQLKLTEDQINEIGKLVAAASEGKLDSQKVLALLTPEQQSKLGSNVRPTVRLEPHHAGRLHRPRVPPG